MPIHLFGDHVLFKFVIGFVALIGLDNTIDRTIDVFGENTFDIHEHQSTNLNAR